METPVEVQPTVLHWQLVFAAVFHALLGSSAYYHINPLNQIDPYIINFTYNSIYRHYGVMLDENGMAWVSASLTAIVAVGAVLGGFAIKYPMDKIGRRDSVMILKNIVVILGSLLQFAARSAKSIELLFIGRFIAGYGITLTMLIPVYLAECSPDQYRGLISMIAFLGWPFYTIVGTVFGLQYIFGTAAQWHFVLLMPALFSFLHMIALPLFPKSPKYLHINKRQTEKAIRSILFYHGADVHLDEVIAEYDREATMAHSKKSAGLREVLTTRHLAWPFWLCIVVNISNNMTGIDIAQQYSTNFIRKMQFSDEMAPIFTVLVTQLPGLFVAIVALLLVESQGRKPLLLVGLLLGIFGTAALFVAKLLDPEGSANTFFGMVGLVLAISGYYIGPSPIANLLPGDLAPQVSRSLTSSASFGTAWIPSVIIVMLYPPLDLAIGAYSILPLTILGIVTFFFLLIFLPETKGKSVDHIVQIWIREDHREEHQPVKDFQPTSYGTENLAANLHEILDG